MVCKLNDFDYNLPSSLIAQSPARKRDYSRLLVLDRETSEITHQYFYNIVDCLKNGDILVLNNSKVFPARLFGKKETDGEVEILLQKEISRGIWEVIGKNLKVGAVLTFPSSILKAEVLKRDENIFTLEFNLNGTTFFREIEKIGKTPLPPYIKKDADTKDKSSYQTVYAKTVGSSAAPTAGLHFTPSLLEKIKDKGVQILEVTLHVGLGTFAPVKNDNILEHKIHSEYYSIDKKVLQSITEAKKEKRRIIAVGTTTTRVLEHLFSEATYNSKLTTDDLSGWTNIFIYPGYRFKCVDGLITNFHLPKSTLLMLVSAFAGKDKIDHAYKEAIGQEYRFFSYGDAMLII